MLRLADQNLPHVDGQESHASGWFNQSSDLRLTRCASMMHALLNIRWMRPTHAGLLQSLLGVLLRPLVLGA